ncbi:hypothetical protein [Marinobacter xestospongiae]|uniref:Uncharacterized protein n=1 Tax=Marinobacter xestospongiae TaxID=994319 RepID=A0ABU3W3L2_9GAMM|nr:hypothetical protein [Marinobacter xestospongiae]MDV2080762.1 hypothetical protein [Marinobacter xestospongiae]
MVLLTILAVLFVVLIVIVPLIERYAPRDNGQQLARYRRFFFPALALLLVFQLLHHYLGS